MNWALDPARDCTPTYVYGKRLLSMGYGPLGVNILFLDRGKRVFSEKDFRLWGKAI